eukprot:m.22382 g.22382  ORF g.22382 m.22382 type:complete len:575 (+) comp7393_c0_seq4:240-1964(+)
MDQSDFLPVDKDPMYDRATQPVDEEPMYDRASVVSMDSVKKKAIKKKESNFELLTTTFAETTKKLRGKQLDYYNANWNDTDPEARDSSPFSRAGILASPRAHLVLLVIGLLCVLQVIVSLALEPIEMGSIVLLVTSIQCFGIWICLRKQYYNYALRWMRWFAFPYLIMFPIMVTCECQPHHANGVCFKTDYESTDWCINSSVDVAMASLFILVFVTPKLGPYQLVTLMLSVTVIFLKSGVFWIITSKTGGKIALGAIHIFVGLWAGIYLYYLVSRRIIAIRKAEAMILQDRQRYDGVWSNIMTDDFKDDYIGDLGKYWKRLSITFVRGGVYQPETRSLAALYNHADYVNPWFQRLVKEWAVEASRKSLAKEETDPTSTPCQYYASDVKDPIRAMEKIHRLYFGRIQKVLDVVRATIVCATVQDIITLLSVITKDNGPRILLLRGKNRFSLKDKAKLTGGYRDLQLSIRCVGFKFEDVDAPEWPIDSQKPNKSMCSKHVAELQIHLKEIFEVKTMVDEDYAWDDDETSELFGSGDLEEELLTGNMKLRKKGRKPTAFENLSGHERYKRRRTILAR